jgi:putative transcriptional regulator
MVEILRSKNLATKFQILVEIANSGPNIQQQDIARRLEVTPQAISDYVRQLVDAGLLISDGRSMYRVTAEGVNWMIEVLRELGNYNRFITKAITNILVCAAVADCALFKGQTVGLKMKDGLLFATDSVGNGARGIAFSDASAGEDIGVSNIEGIVDLEIGKIKILRVPGIQRGGSRAADVSRLKMEIGGRSVFGAIGIEAMTILKQLGIKFSHIYGVKEAAIEAANSGLYPLIVCVDDETLGLISRLEQENIDYELKDLRKGEDHAGV